MNKKCDDYDENKRSLKKMVLFKNVHILGVKRGRAVNPCSGEGHKSNRREYTEVKTVDLEGLCGVRAYRFFSGSGGGRGGIRDC